MKQHWHICLALLALTLTGFMNKSSADTEPFIAISPYTPQVGDVAIPIDLANKPRHFDFGGSVPFVNPSTGVADFATVNFWDSTSQRASVLTSSHVTNRGVPGRVFKVDGYTAIGYLSGDGLVEGKLRTQLNSFPIPARRQVVWNLEFKLGGGSPSSDWTFSKRKFAPATLWQLKTPNLPPTLVMAVDTDPSNDKKLEYVFDQRLDPNRPAVRLGSVRGIDPNQLNHVRIDVNLDERTTAESGRGFVRIHFNEQPIVDRWGPVLQKAAIQPYHWSLAMYMYASTSSLDFDRFVYFRQANMSLVE